MPQDQMIPTGVINDQGRIHRTNKVHDIVPTLRSESHGNEPKCVLEVPVREATRQGYAVARGGEMLSTSRSREVKQEEEESG